VAQLLRDNAADARVADDLRSLAAAYDDDAVAATAEAIEAATADDLALLAGAFTEPPTGEPWWKDTAAQVLRYRWWVAASIAIIGIILFVNPAPLPAGSEEAGTSLIPTSDSQHAAATVTPDVVPQVSMEDPFDFSIASPEPAFDTPSDTSTFDTTPVTYAPSPTALSISQSGYASSLSGTPADQEPPANGLPAESLAGQVTKYSFIRLVGSGASLKLKPLADDGAYLNAAEARVQMCHITTSGWKAARDVAASDAPKYNDDCIEGHLANSVWSFSFSSIHNPVDPNGWAIVPITDDGATFRVTFAPTAAA
jgi:hypothetical protein